MRARPAVLRLIAASTVAGALLLGIGVPASLASTPKGGTIKVWDRPDASGNGGSIVITGAIGDYGTTAKVTSTGKPDSKGTYTELILSKGTILINGGKLQAALQNANPTDFNALTCSASITVSAPTAIVSGTKAYVGIKGSATITASFAFYGPYFTSGKNKGKCNTSNNANPTAIYSSITGIGSVSFS